MMDRDKAATGTRRECRQALVLACGNTLRGDDGVGWRIAERLAEVLPTERVEVILTQQLLPEHAERVSGADVVVFLDCSALTPVGTVSTTRLEAAERLPRIFTHHLDPASILRLAKDLYDQAPAKAVAITVGGAAFDLSEQLSAPVAAAIPIAVEAVRAWLLTWG